MAEGLMRALSDGQIEVHSAGSHPTHLHPEAIRALEPFDIDIRGQKSRHLREFDGQTFDYVITVCDKAREICPTFPGSSRQIHWGFADPVAIVDEHERTAAFTEIAHRLKSRISHLLASLSQPE
jgi:arsenate reductase